MASGYTADSPREDTLEQGLVHDVLESTCREDMNSLIPVRGHEALLWSWQY